MACVTTARFAEDHAEIFLFAPCEASSSRGAFFFSRRLLRNASSRVLFPARRRDRAWNLLGSAARTSAERIRGAPLVDELRERRRAREGALGDAQGRDAARDVGRARARLRRRRGRHARGCFRFYCASVGRAVVRRLRERDRGVGDVVFVGGGASGDRPHEPPRARGARDAGAEFRGVPSGRGRRARRRTRRLPEHAHVEARVFLGIATRLRRTARTQARGRAPTRGDGHGETNARGSRSPPRSVALAPRRVR